LEVDEAEVSIEMPLLLPFSLTKYSTILPFNVLGRLIDGNEINNQLETV
jgi:hypothetical protein